MRIIAFASVLLGLLITTGSPAAADCEGPTIEIERREVVRGGQLLVTGYAWGDNCYDTGSSPDGEGVLGLPIGEINVYVIQGTNEFLVASGSADSDYSFDITVVIPPELTPGTAIVQARWADRIAYSEEPQIVVTDAAPLVSSEPSVAAFEPTTTTTTAGSTTSSTVAATGAPTTTAKPATGAQGPLPDEGGQDNQDSKSSTALAIGGAAGLCAVIFVLLFIRRRA